MPCLSWSFVPKSSRVRSCTCSFSHDVGLVVVVVAVAVAVEGRGPGTDELEKDKVFSPLGTQGIVCVTAGQCLDREKESPPLGMVLLLFSSLSPSTSAPLSLSLGPHRPFPFIPRTSMVCTRTTTPTPPL